MAAIGDYIYNASERERDRRLKDEQFGANLDFQKTQYNNLWDITKSNYDAQQNVLGKFAINRQMESDYNKRLEDVKEKQDLGLGDVLFGGKSYDDWTTGMGQRWNQRLNPWALSDEELAGEPEYQDITPEDLKGMDMNTLNQMIQGGYLENQKGMDTKSLLDLIKITQGGF